MRKLFLIAILLLSSCYEYQQLPNSLYLDKYIGQSEHSIVLHFGPATRYIPDGNGGKILEYKKDGDSFTTTGLYTDAEGHIYSISRTAAATYYLQFYISKNDSVYTYRSNIPGPVKKVKMKGPPKPHNPFVK